MSNKIRLAFVTPHYPPSRGYGGVTIASYRLSRALADLGVDVSILTSDAELDGRVPFEKFRTEEQDNLKIYPYRYCRGRKSAPSLSGHRIIYRIIKQCDLVYLNGLYAYPVTVGAWAALHYNKPYIVALRNGLDPFMYQIRRRKKMIGFHAYVHPILKNASVIHATAEQEVRHAKAFGVDGDFVVIPNGIDSISIENRTSSIDAEIEWPYLKNKRIVLFLSRLSPQKGLDFLIPAWARVRHKNRDAVLVIAGPDYQGHERVVRHLVEEHKVSDSVYFTGEVNGDRKAALYAKASLFVLPSFSENFGNVIAEAFAYKLPVLTTTATPWSSINDYQCGMCVEPQLDAIQNALETLVVKSDDELTQMGRNAEALLKKMNTWQDSAKEFVDLYRRILK
jgi:glycosyltransferase involved in cell wall biosynthesis